jgi:hypothetical protein
MDKFKKINKEFLLTDSSLNSYSYRLLTAGYLLAEFEKNPIGYYMHGTKESGFPREMGVLVKWEDLVLRGDKVYGKPCINLSHPRGQRTVDEIESGFLNAASMGHLVAIEISSNPLDYLENQEGPTVSKWYNRECSIVDIPGNYNALTDLFDEQDQPINLSAFNSQNIKMKQIFFTPAQLTLMNLTADADDKAVSTAFANLVATARKAEGLETANAALKTEKETAVNDLAAFKKSTVEKDVKDLVAAAVNVSKKITKEMGVQLEKDYAGKPTELKNLIDAMPAYLSIAKQSQQAPEGGTSEKIAKMTYDELDKGGLLEDLKATNLDLFNQKGREAFGKSWKDKE